jgi:type II secretory ATPase GspE/PulE/Tfp pilus assembly ATPase PilB-like protein
MTDELRRAVTERRNSSELRRIMVEDGSPTLRADGLRLIAAGITTPDEVLRVVSG